MKHVDLHLVCNSLIIPPLALPRSDLMGRYLHRDILLANLIAPQDF